MVFAYAHLRYHYVVSPQVCRYALLQLPLGALAYAVTFVSCNWAYITLGTLVVLASSGVSIFILHRKTSLWNKLKQKYLHLNG